MRFKSYQYYTKKEEEGMREVIQIKEQKDESAYDFSQENLRYLDFEKASVFTQGQILDALYDCYINLVKATGNKEGGEE